MAAWLGLVCCQSSYSSWIMIVILLLHSSLEVAISFARPRSPSLAPPKISKKDRSSSRLLALFPLRPSVSPPLLFQSHPTRMSNLKRIRGVSVFRPIIYGNTSVLLEAEERGAADHTHRWTVAVRSATSPAVVKRGVADQIGGADDLR